MPRRPNPPASPTPLPGHLRGNGLGVLGLVQVVGDLGATLVAGLLWALVSPTVAFSHAAAWMLAALTRRRRDATPGHQITAIMRRPRNSVDLEYTPT